MILETTTIEVSTETAQLLQAQAAAKRLPLDDYLRSLAERETPEPMAEMTPQERARQWEQWVASQAANTPVIPDDRREILYEDDER